MTLTIACQLCSILGYGWLSLVLEAVQDLRMSIHPALCAVSSDVKPHTSAAAETKDH